VLHNPRRTSHRRPASRSTRLSAPFPVIRRVQERSIDLETHIAAEELKNQQVSAMRSSISPRTPRKGPARTLTSTLLVRRGQ
jgi:hypothetical protein